jgi:hypothetical protein
VGQLALHPNHPGDVRDRGQALSEADGERGRAALGVAAGGCAAPSRRHASRSRVHEVLHDGQFSAG